jgi:hypothetical protein
MRGLYAASAAGAIGAGLIAACASFTNSAGAPIDGGADSSVIDASGCAR